MPEREKANAIMKKLRAEDIYEQLAEECAELAQAASKMARYLRGTNPTNRTEAEIYKMLTEEYSDVVGIADKVLGLKASEKIIDMKLTRWNKRLDERSSR